MGEFIKSDTTSRGRPSTEAYIRVSPDGQAYISAHGHREMLDEAEQAVLMIDYEDGRLGFIPTDDDEGEKVVNLERRRVGIGSEMDALGVERPDGDSVRYDLEIPEDVSFPVVTFEGGDVIENTSSDEARGETTTDDQEDEEENDPDFVVKASQGMLHVPDPNSTFEDPEPQCDHRPPKNGWTSHKIETVPMGFYTHCSSCDDLLSEMYDADKFE